MAKSGLWVDGTSIGRDDAQLLSVLKFAIVPKKSWGLPAFKSDDPLAIFGLADPFSVAVVSAMIDDYVLHEFESPDELAGNIALRKGVVAAMQALCSGAFDGDYAEAVVGVPPTLGYLKNLEVLWAPGSASGKGVLASPLPYEAPDAGWEKMTTTSPWTGYTFMQKPDVALSDALDEVTPFRGECAGALQLSILLGAKAALGGQALDMLSEGYGRAAIGAWRLPEGAGATTEKTFASRFLTQVHDVPDEYSRGSVLGVPGDYFYFKNKDNYPQLAPTGGWQGENCIYMGQDALGGPHYSGMGLAWKTEFALRMFLTNAYLNDVNGGFLADKRAGKTPVEPLHIVEDTQKQVRFTARAVLRRPAAHSGEPLHFKTPSDIPKSLSDQEVRTALIALGGETLNDGNIFLRKISLGAVIDALKIPETALQQRSGAGMAGVDLGLSIGTWGIAIHAADESLSVEDQVSLRAHRDMV